MTRAPRSSRAPKDHYVSKGWQKNFAENDKWVQIFDTSIGRIIERRSIEGNWCERDYSTYWDDDGNPIRAVDDAFTKIENDVIRLCREVTTMSFTEEHKSAVRKLLAIHFVRSKAMRDSHLRILNESATIDAATLNDDPRVKARWLEYEGRLPHPGEVDALVDDWRTHQTSTRQEGVGTQREWYQRILDRLERQHLQVAQVVDESLPGFVLGDVPVVHAVLASQRFGLRDRVAVDDATYLAAPLSRRVTIVATTKRLPHQLVRTKRLVSKINVMSLLASKEVACHPNDARYVHQLWLYRDKSRSFDQPAGR